MTSPRCRPPASVDRHVRTVVIVEGESDRAALETLARRQGRDLEAEGVAIVSIGGAHAIARFLRTLDGEVRVAGLCDAGEEGEFRQALERAGRGAGLDRAAMEKLGFFVCTLDLEDELIRALGPPGVERVVAAMGDLPAWRTFRKQPAQRDRTIEQQLRRFLGTTSGRKAKYARALAEAVELGAAPRPLDRLLAYV